MREAMYKIRLCGKFYGQDRLCARCRAERNVDSMVNISDRLSENTAYLRGLFKNAMDFILREFQIDGISAVLIAMEGLINKQQVTLGVLNPIMRTAILQPGGKEKMAYIQHNVLGAVDQLELYTMDDIILRLMNGFSVLLVDECDYALAFGTQGFEKRSVDEPDTEIMQRGSREGFVETYIINISMIRRRMKTPALKFEPVIIGEESRTPAAICYLDTVVDPDILAEVKKRLAACNLKDVLAAGYLTGYLERPSIFESVGLTERPDTLCGKLHEGRIGILIDGTPTAVYVPYLFVENFQTVDDYANRPFYAAFIRWLKYIAFFLAIFLPGIYVGVATHNPELLPETLLLKVAEAESQTPFPVMIEAILLYFMYELMREAGLRVPKSLSSSVSIVGGLVIGETAVSAGLVSAPSLVVIAMTVITGYVIPKLYEQMAVLRLVFIVVGGIWGVWGILVGLTFILFNLCGKSSFTVPFMAPVAPFRLHAMRDVAVRIGWKRLAAKNNPVQNMPGAGREEKRL